MTYKVSTDFNEQLYYKIAKQSGSKQARDDVKLTRFLINKHPGDVITLHIEDEAFLIALKSSVRIRLYGMATAEDKKRQNRGGHLLKCLYGIAFKAGLSEIYTKTIEGVPFYLSKGFVITGKNERGEYILTKRL